MSAGVLFDAPGPKARRRHLILTALAALAVLGVLFVIYRRMDDRGQLNPALWKPFTQPSTWTAYILPGLWGTVKAAAVAIAGATVLGVLLALGRMSHVRAVSWVVGAIVEVFRAIPVLLVMLFIYGMLTANNIVESKQASFLATVVALVLYNGSVVAEVIRSGVDQLPNGQREAGLSIGLTGSQTLRTILLPQAITAMMPTLVSQLVVVLKDTALGYNVLYSELLYSSKVASAAFSNIVPMLIVVAIIYIVINYLVTKLAELVEKRLQRRGRTAGVDPDADASAEVGASTMKVNAA